MVLTEDAPAPYLIIEETEFARAPLGEAQTLLRDKTVELMQLALRWHDGRRTGMIGWKLGEILPPHNAIQISTGGGKSEESRQAVPGFIREARARSLLHRVLIAVSTHELAKEAQRKMPDGVTVHVWQGRGGKHIGTGEPMCNNMKAVKAAIKIGANVEETACKYKQFKCPFYDTCHYQAQKAAAKKADVVYVAHEALFNMPDAIGMGFGLVIVDEAFWQDGLAIKNKLAVAGLAHELKAFPVRDIKHYPDPYFTAQLRDLIERLQLALDQMPDGFVQRQPLVDAGLTTEDCEEAVKLEWARKIGSGLLPGMSAESQNKAVRQFDFLAQLPAREQMWKAVGDLIDLGDDATGRLMIETKGDKNGSLKWLRINQRKEMEYSLERLPMIITDATLPLKIVRYFVFNVHLALNLEIEAPHATITQVIGKSAGKSALQALKPGKRTPAEEKRVAGNRQAMVDLTRHLARNCTGLVICQLHMEKEFGSIPRIMTGHFGAIEGIDKWGHVDIEVIIGRHLPRGENIQRMAAAVTGLPVIAEGMITQPRIVCGQAINCRVYPDVSAEMIRKATCDTSVVQAAGRVRAVRRTAANPVRVYLILTDVVPDLPIDAVVRFDDLRPSVFDEMFARGPVPQWPGDAFKLYGPNELYGPSLFPSREAAKKTYQRFGLTVSGWEFETNSGTNPYKNILIRECPRIRVRFQPEVRGRGRAAEPRLAFVDPAKLAEARAMLEKALGTLVLFEVLEPWPVAIRDAPYLKRGPGGLVLGWW